jgi:hypothetical protein
MRHVPAPLTLAVALALAACVADGDSADEAPAAQASPGPIATPEPAPAAVAPPAPSATTAEANDPLDDAPSATPRVVRTRVARVDRPAAEPAAPAPAGSSDATEAPPAAPSLLQRMVESITAMASPAETGAAADRADPPAAAPALAVAAPATAQLPPALPAPERTMVALAPPPAAPEPRAGPRPTAAACADVTADGPAKEVELDAVRRTLRGGDYRRGSFETNAAYRARLFVKLEAVGALVAAQTGRAELVFSLPIPDYRLSYDADARELWIGSELGLLRGGSAIGMGDFILVSAAERRIGSHLSTIAYGTRRVAAVEREVARVVGDQLGVIVPGGSSIGWPANFARLRVAMTPAEAAAAKGALAVLFVARLQEPYLVTGEFIQEAKLDDPVEKRLTVEAIKVAIDCAALYDRKTGRVLRTLVPAGG